VVRDEQMCAQSKIRYAAPDFYIGRLGAAPGDEVFVMLNTNALAIVLR